MLQPESNRVLTLLNEVENLQVELEERLIQSNEQVSTEVIKLQDLNKTVEKYVGILHEVSVDMVNICERLNSLNSRVTALQNLKP